MRATRRMCVGILVLPVLLLIASPALAQGGGGGGGKGELYGDLYVIERDGNGEPILDALGCKQPIAADCSFIPLVGEQPLFLEEEEEDPCAIDPAYLYLAQGIEMGRLSVSRSNPKVIDQAYGEALDILNQAIRLRLDPAGRFEMIILEGGVTIGASLIRKTIDSPLENLGLYSRIMIEGCLPPVETQEGVHELSDRARDLLASIGLANLLCPGGQTFDPAGVGQDDMMVAAPLIAAAADKVAHVGLDAIINVNTYLGINEVDNQGNITYFDWRDSGSGGWFYYGRDEHFPPGVMRRLLTLEQAPDLFRARWVDVRGTGGADFPQVGVCRGGSRYPFSCDGTDPGGECGGVNWFTQRAEHARSIVWFLHNWSVPVF